MTNLKQIFQLCANGASDPLLVAQAYSDYFESVYAAISDKIARVGLGLQGENFEQKFDNESITFQGTNEEGEPIQINALCSDLHGQMLKQANSQDMNVPVIIHDYFSDTDISFDSIDSLVESLGQTVDAVYLSWQSYKSLTSDYVNTSADRFINSLNLTMSKTSSSILQVASGIYDIISSTSSNLTDKIAQISNFIGLSQLIQHSNDGEIDYTKIDLNNYLGVNPVIGWLNKLDISFESIRELPEAVMKLSVNVLSSIGSWMINTGTKVYNSISNWVKHTFIDPIDYKCDGDQIGFFDIPGKFMLTTKYSNDIPYKRLLNSNKTKSLWMNFGNVYYRVLLNLRQDADDKPILYYERYVKPTDPVKVYQIMKANNFEPNNGTYLPDLTIKEYLLLLNALQTADLSLPNNVSEREVARGILTSYYLENVYSELYTTIYSVLINQYPNTDINKPISEDERLINYRDPAESPYFYEIKALRSALGGFGDFQQAIYHYGKMNEWDGAWTNDGITLHGLSPDIPETITNKYFIQLLTSEWYDTGEEQNPTWEVVDAFQNHGMIDTYLMVHDHEAGGGRPMLYPIDLLSRAAVLPAYWLWNYNADNLEKGDLTKTAAYVPYIHANDFQINKNCHIMSDSDNIEAISMFLTGVLTTVAVVSVSIIAITSVRKLYRNRNIALANANASSMKLSQAIISNDSENVLKYYSEWTHNKRLSTLYNVLLGSSGGAIATTIYDTIDPITPSDLNKVISLIK